MQIPATGRVKVAGRVNMEGQGLRSLDQSLDVVIDRLRKPFVPKSCGDIGYGLSCNGWMRLKERLTPDAIQTRGQGFNCGTFIAI